MQKLTGVLCLCALILSGCKYIPEANINPHRLADENGRFVMVNDIELYITEAGDPANPAVLLVHGFGASTFSWRLNMQPLADAGYYVVAVDRPGFGLSDKSPDIDYHHAAQADLLAALMDTLGIEQAVVIGHSQGGNVVAHFAVRHPERLIKLVLVAGAVIPSDFEREAGSMDIGSFATEGSPALNYIAERPWLRFFMQWAIGLYFKEARVSELMASAYGDNALITDEIAEGYYRAFRTPGWENGLIAMSLASDGNVLSKTDLQTITTPTLLLWGDADTWVPLAGGQFLDELLPNSTLIVYPNIGHSPMDTVPDEFNADLLEFLNAE